MDKIRFNPNFFYTPSKRPQSPRKLAVPKWNFRDPILNSAFAPARSGESLFSKEESAHLGAVTHRIMLDRFSNFQRKFLGYLTALSGGAMTILGPASYVVDDFEPGIAFTPIGVIALVVGLKILQKK